jgi:hypothetical protein
MNSLDLIKLSDYTPENINSLSNVEKLILFYFKGESDQVKSLIGELNQEDVCYAIDKFYSSETVKVFDLLIDTHILTFLRSNHGPIKEMALDYLKNNAELKLVKAQYNIETNVLKISSPKIGQILTFLNPVFHIGEISKIQSEFEDLEIPTNVFLDVDVVQINGINEYKISPSETKKQIKLKEDSKKREFQVFNKFNIAFSSSVVLASMLFSVDAHAQNYSQAIDSAKRAALIQSGIQKQVDDVQHKVTQMATDQVKAMGLEKPLAMAAIGYKTIQSREVNFHVNNILIDQSKYSLTLSPDKVQVVVQISF